MESRVNPGANGGADQSRSSKAGDGAAAGRISMALCDTVLRIVVVATTLVAAIMMGVDRETKTVLIQLAPTLPPLSVAATAKSSYAISFVYHVVANSIACVYSAVSLAMLVTNRAKRSSLAFPISVGDLAMVALLFSAGGAAADFGLLGERGNSHVRWDKVCNVFGRFCTKVLASIFVSFLGSAAYLAVVMLTILGLHKRAKQIN